MAELPAESAPKDPQQDPLLGLATTRHLLHELAIRFEVPTPDGDARRRIIELLEDLNDRTLDYRTADV